MITFLHGILEEKHPTRAVLNVGGVGYEVLVPLSTFDRLPATQQACRLLTHEHVREDAHQLFGFATDAERDAFEMLIGTSGIGPKLAISALSTFSVRELKAAIVNGDVRRLSSISGVGKKTAERMIVELRDKIGDGEALEAVTGVGTAGSGALRDAMLALTALGYKQDEAARMVKHVSADAANASVEDIVRRALASR
jgi:Holliday junction DNA helicase RuvA